MFLLRSRLYAGYIYIGQQHLQFHNDNNNVKLRSDDDDKCKPVWPQGCGRRLQEVRDLFGLNSYIVATRSGLGYYHTVTPMCGPDRHHPRIAAQSMCLLRLLLLVRLQPFCPI